MSIRFYLSLLLVLTGLDYASAQSVKAINYIKDNAVAISTNPDDTTNFNDLQPLKAVLANRRVVGMGEATHGSHEFFAMKHRMLEFLVKQMGFRVFAIEANFTECRAINDYVLHGKGDAKKAIAGMYFWTWNTAEVLKMVEWIRSYNMGKSPADQVKFYGFDMQFDKVASSLVRSKLIKLDSDYFNKHFRILDTLKINRGTFSRYTPSQADSIRLLLKNVAEYIGKQRGSLLKIYSEDEVEYLNRDARLLEQCLDECIGFNEKHGVKGTAARDRYMAENVEWILRHEEPNSKVMLWAHNGHITKLNRRMGGHLKDSLKDQYYSIGFDFNKGGFRSVDTKDNKLKNFIVNDALKGSTGEFFSQLNVPAFFIDIKGMEKEHSPANSFFNNPMLSRDIGSGFDTEQEKFFYIRQSLNQRFDGLIFINEVTAAVPI